MGMQRDYLEVISGSKVDGQMPKWERELRGDVAKLIEESEKAAEDAESKAGAKTPDDATAIEEPTAEVLPDAAIEDVKVKDDPESVNDSPDQMEIDEAAKPVFEAVPAVENTLESN